MSGKQPSPRTLLDEQKVLDKLGRLQDPLEKLSSIIDPKLFSPGLNELLTKEPKGKGGRPACEYVLMFKILILQHYYNLRED